MLRCMECIRCHRDLRPTNFHRSPAWKSGRSSTCKTCRASWRQKNTRYRAAQLRAKKRGIQRSREFVWCYLAQHPCKSCGERDPCVLTFDHVRNKYMNVSRMIINGCTPPRLLMEIKKCNVLCFNCHMRRTMKQLRYGKYTKLGVTLRKLRLP